jgi:pyruvate kinase
MSVFFVVTPVLAGMAWPVLAASVSAALTSMGYNVVKSKSHGLEIVKNQESVDLDLKNSENLAETLGEEEKLLMERNGITLTFSKGKDNRCQVHVEGPGKTKKELALAGQEASNRILQAHVYGKIMAEAQKRGLKVVEKQNEDGKIHLRLRKWG